MPLISPLVLTADGASLATIETNVNALRASFTPPLAALTSDEILALCIQVGLNALLNYAEVPNTTAAFPVLSIAGQPGVAIRITIDADLAARVSFAATAFGQTDDDVAGLAVHAAVLMLIGTATNAYRASF